MALLTYMKHLLGISLSGKMRIWKNDFKKYRYYRVDIRTVYSYLSHYSLGDTYSVSFSIFCDNPMKGGGKLNNYRTIIHDKSFMTRIEAMMYQEKEIKRAAYFFPNSKFFREKLDGSREFFHRAQWIDSEDDPNGVICPKCNQSTSYVTNICPNCGDFMI